MDRRVILVAYEQEMFSVIIPTYRCAKYLEECVRSVLAQTYENFEILLLDDASDDDTWSFIQRLARQDERIIAVQNKQNLGAAMTRNRGIEMARGEYIAFLDGDDRWLPEKLAVQLQCLDETKCDVCYTGYSFINKSGLQIRHPYMVPEVFMKKELLKENFIGCSTAAFRAKTLGPVRMRSEYAHEDYVFWLELESHGAQFRGINQPLVEYRLLSESRSANKLRSAWGRWRIVRDYMKLPLPQAIVSQAHYMFRGVKKYYG